MIIKTSELEGEALDWAVAKATDTQWPTPSTNWVHGGPLIAEKVTVTVDTEDGCYADCGAKAHAIKNQTPLDEYDGSGPTILIAAMRAIVSSELGETVDVPEELVG